MKNTVGALLFEIDDDYLSLYQGTSLGKKISCSGYLVEEVLLLARQKPSQSPGEQAQNAPSSAPVELLEGGGMKLG